MSKVIYSHRIYVAAPWVEKAKAKAVAQEVREAGLVVISRWHDTTHNSNIYEDTPELMQGEALKDWEDVTHATHLLYLNLQKSEGKATELGISLARGIPIYVVGGNLNNVFLHLPWIYHVPDVEVAIVEMLENG